MLGQGCPTHGPRARMGPGTALNVAQHKIMNPLKTFCLSVLSVFVCLRRGPETPMGWTPLLMRFVMELRPPCPPPPPTTWGGV